MVVLHQARMQAARVSASAGVCRVQRARGHAHVRAANGEAREHRDQVLPQGRRVRAILLFFTLQFHLFRLITTVSLSLIKR